MAFSDTLAPEMKETVNKAFPATHEGTTNGAKVEPLNGGLSDEDRYGISQIPQSDAADVIKNARTSKK